MNRAGFGGWSFHPDDATFDPYRNTRNAVQANPYTVPANPAYAAFRAPANSFGGIKFSLQPNQWSSYLGGLNNQQDIDALGLGSVENADTGEEVKNRYLAAMADSMSPNALGALRNNWGRVESAFNQARATQPGLRRAQFVAGIDAGNTVNALSPQQKFMPVTFKRVRISGG